MVTIFSNFGKKGRDANVHGSRDSLYRYAVGILTILFMGNLSALIDAFIHPEIQYLDDEHLIVGGVTTFVTTVLFIIVMKFFSKLRQKENELQKLNVELEKKVEERTRQLVETQGKLLKDEKLAMLGRIAGSMGNELRNPLGVMSNAVFFLQNVMPDADETVKEYLEIIGMEIDNSQRIISDLLDFCSGRSPRTEPFAVHDLIRHSREMCIRPENISFQAELPAALPLVQVDPLQMEQVFQHLFANAVQAMPNGGVLRIAARHDGNFVEISVTDSGVGIPAEIMEKLFQPLFTTKSRGIGLGLAIAQKLTEANGGRIEVESRLGEGTTFNVILPVKEERR